MLGVSLSAKAEGASTQLHYLTAGVCLGEREREQEEDEEGKKQKILGETEEVTWIG